MMKKTMVSLVLAMLLVLFALPMTAFAASAPEILNIDGTPYYFANGTPITIEAAGSGTAIYYMNGSQKVYVNPNGANGDDLSGVSVYGGCGADYDVAALDGDTSIIMTGGTVANIFGSGDGFQLLSGHVNNVSISMTGGTVSGGIYAGSQATIYGNVTISVTGGTVGTVALCNQHSNATAPAVCVEGNASLTIYNASVNTVHGGDGYFPINGTVSGYIDDSVTFTYNASVPVSDMTTGFDRLLYHGDGGFKLRSHVAIPAGATLTVNADETLNVEALSARSLTNNGTLVNNGTIYFNEPILGNGQIINNGTIHIYEPILGNTITGSGTVNRYTAYISGVSSVNSLSAKVDNAACTPTQEIASGNLYLWGMPDGKARVTLNGSEYCGVTQSRTAVELKQGYAPVTDLSGIPSAMMVNSTLTLNPALTPATPTFEQTLSYEIVSQGDTGATVSGNVLTVPSAGTLQVKITATDGYTSYSETFSITAQAITGNTIDVSQGGDITISKENDSQLRITYSGYSGGYKLINKSEFITFTGTATNKRIIVESGEANIVLNNCSISFGVERVASPMEILSGASVDLMLMGQNTLTTDTQGWGGLDDMRNAAIYVPGGAKLDIRGEGQLTVSAKGGAAIGDKSYGSSVGTIAIHSGTVNASVSDHPAAPAPIGGGYKTNGGSVIINGGTIRAQRGGNSSNDIGNGYQGSGVTVTINGGSVNAVNNSVANPTNGSSSVSRYIITLDGVTAVTKVTAVEGIGDYGLEGVYTDESGKLYFYLPEGVVPTQITAGGKNYIPAGDGKYVQHEHSWSYNAEGNTITATCAVDDCPSKDGGSVTIKPPASDVYTGSAIVATLENSLTTGAAVGDITYTATTGALTGDQPVNAGSYTASVSVEGETASATFDIVHQITLNAGAHGTLNGDSTVKTGVDGKLTALPADPTVSDETYTFTGWFDAAEGGSKITTDTVFSSNATIYAQYQDHQHSWNYTASGNIITATCQNANCPVVNATVTITLNAPDTSTLAYDGQAKQVTVTQNPAGVFSDLTVVYSKDGNELNDAPTNAGDYTASLTMGEGSNAATAQVDFTIAPLAITSNNVTVGTFAELIYNGTAQTPNADVTVNSLTVTGAWSNVTNVADTTTFTADGNFTGTLSGYQTGMKKATPQINPLPKAVNPVYTGVPQALITAGAVNGGELQYSLDNQNWSTTIPTATDVKEYTVWYRVVGNENYADVAAASLSASITTSGTGMTATAQETYVYGQEITISVSGITPTGEEPTASFNLTRSITPQTNGDNTVAVYNGSEQLTQPQVVPANGALSIVLPTLDVDSYTLTVRFSGNKNMAAVERTVSFTVTQADGSATVTLADWVYGNTANTPVAQSETNTDKPPIIEYKVRDAEDSTYTTAGPTDVGEYTVRASFEATQNYKAVTATDDFAITISGSTMEATLKDDVDEYTYGDTVTVIVSGVTPTKEAPALLRMFNRSADTSNKIAIFNGGQQLTEYKAPAEAGVSFELVGLNAGTYNLTAEFTGNDNMAATSAPVPQFVIKQANGSGSVTITGWTYGTTANAPVPATTTNDANAVTYLYTGTTNAGVSYSSEAAPTEAGKYSVTATFAETTNYTAYTTAAATFTIAKTDDLSDVMPSNLTAIYGHTLSTVTLPQNWSWANGENVVGNKGENKHKANYAGDENHNAKSNVELTVKVGQSESILTADSDKDAYTYGETVTINAVLTQPKPSMSLLRGFVPAVSGQLAVYNGTTQISEAITVGYSDDSIPFTFNTVLDGLTPDSYTLTVKFIESDNMAEASADVSFTVSWLDLTTVPDPTLPDGSTGSGEGQDGDGWFSGDVTVTAPDGYEISTDGGEPWGPTGTIDTSGSPDGENTYDYLLQNTQTGEIGTGSITIQTDNTDPVVSTPTVNSTDTTATISAPATDVSSGIAGSTLTQTGGEPAVTITNNGNGTFSITGMTPGETYTFDLTVTDNAGNTTTITGITVTASAAVAIVWPTEDQIVTVYEGEQAEMSVIANNAFRYQWYINYNDGTGWHEKRGATSATYISSPTELDNSGFQYGCIAFGESGEVYAKSPIFTLEVLKVPVLPETGDDRPIGLWISLLTLSLTGMLLMLHNGKRRFN